MGEVGGEKQSSLPFSLPSFPLSPETPDTQATSIADSHPLPPSKISSPLAPQEGLILRLIADSSFRIDPKPRLYITFTRTDIAQGIG